MAEAGLPADFPLVWKYREKCYEIYFSSPEELARSIYGLALSAGDIKADISLERFSKGVQGFHYDLEQVLEWLAAIDSHKLNFYTSQERRLVNWLLADKVLTIKNQVLLDNRLVSHLLGAASGRRRTMEQNLTHERLHVMWSEDTDFRRQAINKWQQLSPEQKEEVYASLPGYAQDREMQIVEEWWIRQCEKLPDRELDQLLGIE